MGMTIDKTIEFFNGLECHTPQAKDARDVAVDTMRKYQKIVKILNDDSYYEDYGNSAEHFIVSAISEVIEDGKD